MKTTYPESPSLNDGYISNCFNSDMSLSRSQYSETLAKQLVPMESQHVHGACTKQYLDNKHRGLQAILLAPGIYASNCLTPTDTRSIHNLNVTNLAVKNSEVFMKRRVEITDDTTETAPEYEITKNSRRAKALRNARARKKLEAMREEKELEKWLEDVWSEPGDRALTVDPEGRNEFALSLMAA